MGRLISLKLFQVINLIKYSVLPISMLCFLEKKKLVLGFQVDLTLDEMKKCLSDSGCCIAGQTASLVPADRIMYATRDITGTVDNANFVTGIYI